MNAAVPSKNRFGGRGTVNVFASFALYLFGCGPVSLLSIHRLIPAETFDIYVPLYWVGKHVPHGEEALDTYVGWWHQLWPLHFEPIAPAPPSPT